MNNPKLITSVEVPGYSGEGTSVPAGSLVRITDVRGAQIGDVFAISSADHAEYLSTSVTRAVTWRLFPQIGECFYTTLRRPILTLVADDSPGIHDMLFAPCDAKMFADLGVEGYHPNCRDNFIAAAKKLDINLGVVPDPVNIFENTPVLADSTLGADLTPTKPGDSITFRAEMDLILIVTACSVDIGVNNINGGESTPLRIEVFAE